MLKVEEDPDKDKPWIVTPSKYKFFPDAIVKSPWNIEFYWAWKLLPMYKVLSVSPLPMLVNPVIYPEYYCAPVYCVNF